MLPIVREAVEIVGGVNVLAARVGIAVQNFYQWKEIPPRRVLAIEAATGGRISRYRMRPDIYPPGDVAGHGGEAAQGEGEAA
ncbi:MAG: Cro/CI family transcriptional regulator [Alphaproteobacteria bacterium]|nr:Cro/CI family transcriptional regulator [Alphaproteobacteria bacterium]